MFSTKRRFGEAAKRLQRQATLSELAEVIIEATDNKELHKILLDTMKESGHIKLSRDRAENWLSEAIYEQPYAVTKKKLSNDE